MGIIAVMCVMWSEVLFQLHHSSAGLLSTASRLGRSMCLGWSLWVEQETAATQLSPSPSRSNQPFVSALPPSNSGYMIHVCWLRFSNTFCLLQMFLLLPLPSPCCCALDPRWCWAGEPLLVMGETPCEDTTWTRGRKAWKHGVKSTSSRLKGGRLRSVKLQKNTHLCVFFSARG